MILISDINYFTQSGSTVGSGPSSLFPAENLKDQHPYRFTRFDSVDIKDTFVTLEWTKAGKPRTCYLADYGEPGEGAECRLRLDHAPIPGPVKAQPSAILSATNYAQNLAPLQADPYNFAPPSVLSPINVGQNGSITIEFSTPDDDLNRGERLQTFAILARRSGTTSSAPVSVVVRLFEGSSLRGNLAGHEFTDQNWRLFIVSWDASELVDQSGEDVRLNLSGISNGADGVEFGGIAWYQETVASPVYDSGWLLLPRTPLELSDDHEAELWGQSSALDVGPMRRNFAYPDIGNLVAEPKHARLDFRLRPTTTSPKTWKLGAIHLGPAYSPEAQNWNGQLSTRVDVPESRYTNGAAPSEPARVLEFGFDAMASRDASILHERMIRAANSGQAVFVNAIPEEPTVEQPFAVMGKITALADWVPFARGRRHTLTGYEVMKFF